MKKSWKYGLIGAAAALAAVLLPYEIDRNDDGEFSYNSLLLGVYRRKRSDGEHATAVTLFNAPALTDESRKAREAAVRHVIEAAAEQELFADEDDPTEGAASAPAAAPVTEETPAVPVEEAPAEPDEEPETPAEACTETEEASAETQEPSAAEAPEAQEPAGEEAAAQEEAERKTGTAGYPAAPA